MRVVWATCLSKGGTQREVPCGSSSSSLALVAVAALHEPLVAHVDSIGDLITNQKAARAGRARRSRTRHARHSSPLQLRGHDDPRGAARSAMKSAEAGSQYTSGCSSSPTATREPPRITTTSTAQLLRILPRPLPLLRLPLLEPATATAARVLAADREPVAPL